MARKNDLTSLLARKRLSGYDFGLLLTKDFREKMRGEPGFITDADCLALCKTVTTEASRSVVRDHVEACQWLHHQIPEAELAGMTAERDLYRAVCWLTLNGRKGIFSEEERVRAKNIDVNLRLSLMVWFGHCAAIEVMSEHIRVDFMELLEVPKKSLMNVLKLYNTSLDLLSISNMPEYLSALRLRPIDVAELQPTDEWREELAMEKPGGAGSQWYAKALEITYDKEAFDLPVGISAHERES